MRAARDWYENRRTGLGAEFLAEMEVNIQRLLDDPERSPDYYRGFRRLLSRRFPYKLFYRIEGRRVIVFRVLHARRDYPALLPADVTEP